MVKSEYMMRLKVFQEGMSLCLRLHKLCNTKFRLILSRVKALVPKKKSIWMKEVPQKRRLKITTTISSS